MAKASGYRWGEWIAARAEGLGFKRQKDIADRIGCSRAQLTRWLRMDVPPEFIRKGFDRTLLGVLQTSRPMLFKDYSRTPPGEAPRVLLSPDQLFPEPMRLLYSAPPDTMLSEVSALLKSGEVEKVLDYAVMLILAARDERAPRLDDYMALRTVKSIKSPEALREFTRAKKLEKRGP